MKDYKKIDISFWIKDSGDGVLISGRAHPLKKEEDTFYVSFVKNRTYDPVQNGMVMITRSILNALTGKNNQLGKYLKSSGAKYIEPPKI